MGFGRMRKGEVEVVLVGWLRAGLVDLGNKLKL